MRFERKIFASFGLCAIACALTAYTIYSSFERRMIASFEERYKVLAATVANTLNQLDLSSDHLIQTALTAAVTHVSHLQRLPTNAELKRLRDVIGMMSVDVIRNDGTFVRSSSFPEYSSINLYSYCEGYRRLFSSERPLMRTPIMRSEVFGRGMKYSLLGLRGGKYAVNVGYELDLIGKTLSQALSSDENIRTLELYTPSGKKLGEYSSEATNTDDFADLFVVTTRVSPSVVYCCECARVGLMRADSDEYYYVLKLKVSRSTLSSAIGRLRSTALAILALATLISLFVSKLIARSLVRRISTLSQKAAEIMTSKQLSDRLAVPGRDEVSELAEQFDAMLTSLESAQNDLLTHQQDKTFAQVASQVSHDIRSPLTALQLLLSQVSDWPEQHRVLARSAIARITDIANTLLARSRQIEGTAAGVREPTIELVPAILDGLISEKRLSAKAHSGIEIDLSFEGSYGTFARLNASEFKRAVSNVVDNACEAMERASGTITVKVRKDGNDVLVTVRDNGRGMPEHILTQLGTRGLSYGKPDRGNGLGVHYAKLTIEDFGGNFSVESKVGLGTTVCIKLPLAPAPDWFVEQLELPYSGTIISIDDDRAIHQIWRDRLAEQGFHLAGGRHVFFTSLADAAEYIGRLSPAELGSSLFLIDHDLRQLNGMTGLDLIRNLKIAESSILVTSRYEEPLIRSESAELGLKIIPKTMAPLVPITHKESSYEFKSVQNHGELGPP